MQYEKQKGEEKNAKKILQYTYRTHTYGLCQKKHTQNSEQKHQEINEQIKMEKSQPRLKFITSRLKIKCAQIQTHIYALNSVYLCVHAFYDANQQQRQQK